MSTAPNPTVPEGFRAREFGGGFMAVNGPLYARRTEAAACSSAFASRSATATRCASATAA